MLRKCNSTTASAPTPITSTYSSNPASISNRGARNKTFSSIRSVINKNRLGKPRSDRPQMSPDEYRTWKLRTRCSTCGKHGHWETDNLHNDYNYKFWQFGTGSHTINKRKILGSIQVIVILDNVNTVTIRHIFVAGSSHWVVGRNVTRSSDVLNYSGRKILMRPVNGIRDSI